ncbi:hypothetical protein [Actinoplanes sp. NPDC026623]|uniref:hypothetical protein n=1 Tax=Actinoplanes sp. NPDC026623 TaxID=3155610 RepID=UPI0033EB1649
MTNSSEMSDPERIIDLTAEAAGSPLEPFSVDLTKVENAPPAGTDEDSRIKIATAEFQRQLAGRQEWVRTALAVGAFLSLVGILVVLLIAVLDGLTVDNVEKVATVVVTPLTGIVGTIIGFYFAEKRGNGGN